MREGLLRYMADRYCTLTFNAWFQQELLCHIHRLATGFTRQVCLRLDKLEHFRLQLSARQINAFMKVVESFGAGVVISYEYNEFVREQKRKTRQRKLLAFFVVFFPGCILFAWGLCHMLLGLFSVARSAQLTRVISTLDVIATATMILNQESGQMVLAVMDGFRWLRILYSTIIRLWMLDSSDSTTQNLWNRFAFKLP